MRLLWRPVQSKPSSAAPGRMTRGSAPPFRPRLLATLEQAPPFPGSGGTLVRHPRETKGVDYRVTTAVAATTCGPNGSCC